jgi:hypothetical protein
MDSFAWYSALKALRTLAKMVQLLIIGEVKSYLND